MQPPNRLSTSLITIFVFATCIRASGELKIGSAFPDLASFKFEGQLPAELKGKIVFVDFWASWCGPCEKSFPVMDELQKKFGPQGLVIIAVNEDEKKPDMERFLKEKKVSFAIVRDAAQAGQKLVDKVDVSAMPSSFIVDQSGRLCFSHSGFHGTETKKEYEKQIESLLKK